MSYEEVNKENKRKTSPGFKKLSLPIRSISFSGRKSINDIRHHVSRSISAKTPTAETVLMALHPLGKISHCYVS